MAAVGSLSVGVDVGTDDMIRIKYRNKVLGVCILRVEPTFLVGLVCDVVDPKGHLNLSTSWAGVVYIDRASMRVRKPIASGIANGLHPLCAVLRVQRTVPVILYVGKHTRRLNQIQRVFRMDKTICMIQLFYRVRRMSHLFYNRKPRVFDSLITARGVLKSNMNEYFHSLKPMHGMVVLGAMACAMDTFGMNVSPKIRELCVSRLKDLTAHWFLDLTTRMDYKEPDEYNTRPAETVVEWVTRHNYTKRRLHVFSCGSRDYYNWDADSRIGWRVHRGPRDGVYIMPSTEYKVTEDGKVIHPSRSLGHKRALKIHTKRKLYHGLARFCVNPDRWTAIYHTAGVVHLEVEDLALHATGYSQRGSLALPQLVKRWLDTPVVDASVLFRYPPEFLMGYFLQLVADEEAFVSMTRFIPPSPEQSDREALFDPFCVPFLDHYFA